MAIVVKIGGVTVGHTSVTITGRYQRAASCSFGVAVAVGTQPYSRGDAVTVLDGATTVFSGVIVSINEYALDPAESGKLMLSVAATQTEILTRRRVQGRFLDTAAGTIITTLNTRFGLGLTTTGVDTGPTLDDINFDDFPTAEEAFTRVAERSDGYLWYLDAAGVLYFNRGADSTAALHDLTDSPSAKSYDSLQVYRVSVPYFNRVFVLGGRATHGEITESWASVNGQRVYFETRHPIGAGGVNKITYDGSTYDLDEAGKVDDTTTDFLFSSATRGGIERLIGGTIGNVAVDISYTPTHVLVYAFRDDAGYGTNGLFETTIIDETIRTVADAVLAAKAFLEDHSVHEAYKIAYTTWDDPGPAGSLQTVTLSARNLSGTFVLEMVTRTEVVAGVWRYEVQATEDRALRALGNRAGTAIRRRSSVREEWAEPLIARSLGEWSDAVAVTFSNTIV